jgi:Holliday junction DNA helicase RuvB
VANNSLNRLGIDENGLDDMDRSILTALVEKFNGGPVGLESLGVAISEDARTIEEVYEPYLIKEGFIQRTSRGRKALDKTFSYLDIKKSNNDSQVKIF